MKPISIKKPQVILLILILSLISFYSDTSLVDSKENSNATELTNSSGIVVFTANNVSLIPSLALKPGEIFGGHISYWLSASLDSKFDLSLSIYFSRGTENFFITLSTSNDSVWNGPITFSGCCSSSLLPLSLTFSLVNNNPTNLSNKILFIFFYSIMSNNFYKFLITKDNISSVNVLGYPYPPREFIVGLMILLLGILPVYIVTKIILKYTR